MPSRWCGNGVQAEDELLRRLEKSVGVQMKLSLVFLMILFLTLGGIACSSSPDTQKEIKSSADGSSTLGRVALEVPTIF